MSASEGHLGRAARPLGARAVHSARDEQCHVADVPCGAGAASGGAERRPSPKPSGVCPQFQGPRGLLWSGHVGFRKPAVPSPLEIPGPALQSGNRSERWQVGTISDWVGAP